MTTTDDTTKTATSIIQIREIAHNEDHPLSRTATLLLEAIRDFYSARKSAANSAEQVRLAAVRIAQQVMESTSCSNFVDGHARNLREAIARRDQAVNNIHNLSYCMSIYLDWPEVIGDERATIMQATSEL